MLIRSLSILTADFPIPVVFGSYLLSLSCIKTPSTGGEMGKLFVVSVIRYEYSTIVGWVTSRRTVREVPTLGTLGYFFLASLSATLKLAHSNSPKKYPKSRYFLGLTYYSVCLWLLVGTLRTGTTAAGVIVNRGNEARRAHIRSTVGPPVAGIYNRQCKSINCIS